MSTTNDDADLKLEIIEKESDHLFIELIKEKPCLYNKQSKDYSDKMCRKNAMEEIANFMEDTVENCEKKWSHFQATYNREKMQEELESGSEEPSKRKKWVYYERMKTLFPTDTSKCTYSMIAKTVSSLKDNNIDELVLHALNDMQAIINESCQSLEATEHDTQPDLNDPDLLIGKLIVARLNQLPAKIRKKKIKNIMKLLINDASDSDDE